MKKNHHFFMYFLFVQMISAQVGINTANPSSNAALEVASNAATKIGGFVPPTVTEVQRDAIPVTADDDGLMLYVTVPCGDRRLQLFNAATMVWENVFSTEVPFREWDFGNDITTWPPSPGIGTDPVIIDDLGLVPIINETNFGAVNNNAQTFSDGFTAVRRFQMNGAGYPIGPFQVMPDRRYIYFGVNGPCRVKVWFRTNSNGASRTLYVTNGTEIIGSETTNSGGNDNLAILEAIYTGGPSNLYVFGSAACNLYKLEVCGSLINSP